MKNTCEKLTFVTADDYPVITKSVAFLLKELYDDALIYRAHKVDELIEIVTKEKVDLIVLDLSIPKDGLLSFLSILKNYQPSVKILVFDSHQSEPNLEHIIGAGANYYLNKTSTIDDFILVILNLMNYSK